MGRSLERTRKEWTTVGIPTGAGSTSTSGTSLDGIARRPPRGAACGSACGMTRGGRRETSPGKDRSLFQLTGCVGAASRGGGIRSTESCRDPRRSERPGKAAGPEDGMHPRRSWTTSSPNAALLTSEEATARRTCARRHGWPILAHCRAERRFQTTRRSVSANAVQMRRNTIAWIGIGRSGAWDLSNDRGHGCPGPFRCPICIVPANRSVCSGQTQRIVAQPSALPHCGAGILPALLSAGGAFASQSLAGWPLAPQSHFTEQYPIKHPGDCKPKILEWSWGRRPQYAGIIGIRAGRAGVAGGTAAKGIAHLL